MSRGNPHKSSAITTPYGIDHSTELSPAVVERELVHNRQITLNGYVRIDGLFDIEAELTDHKTYSFPCHLEPIDRCLELECNLHDKKHRPSLDHQSKL